MSSSAVSLPTLVLKWCYPFPRKGGGEVTDPQVFYHALGKMTDGFFPIGVNGFPHGGVHFGANSATCVDQSGGVRLHADGEIVAYRLDERYPHLQFTQDSRWAMYSTGFVLVRHRMTLPPAPGHASPGHTAHGHSAPQPADETLTFFSLFMHMADWRSYQQDGKLARPDWWLGADVHRVAGPDQQKADAQGKRGDATGTLVYTEPKAGAKKGQFTAGTCVAFLRKDSKVIVGEQRGEWWHIKSVTSGAMTSATHDGVLGMKERSVPWQLPDGGVRGRTPLTPEDDWGWIHLHDQKPVREPERVGEVVIPPRPIAVKAGTLMGQIGQYLDYERSDPLPPTDRRELLHLEVFAGEAFTTFLAKSRARAAQLPASERTILLVQPGAKLVQPMEPDRLMGEFSKMSELIPTKDSPTSGPWVKVQPLYYMPGSRFPEPYDSPVWVERKYESRFKSTPNGLAAWSRYPLQVKAATEPVNGRLLILPRTQLDGLDGDVRAIDDHGVRWWRVQAIAANGEYQSGWVCEKDHPGTQWESPWAWPGFELVDATGIQLTDAFLRNLSVTDSANSEEKRKFAPSTEAVNNSVLLRRLEEIVARSPVPGGGTQPPDEDGRIAVTAVKLQRATGQPGLGSELAHLVLRYESEWGGNMARWEAITPLMRNARENWECELQRVKKLQWWDQVKGKVDGFPDSPVVHHIHPVALVGNFAAWKAIDIDMFVRLYKPAHSVDFGWYSKENSPKSKLPPLSKKSEENLRALLHWVNELYLSCHRDSKIEYIAYMLATARVEAYDFQAGAFFGPISEIISYETAEHQYGCGPTAAAPDRARNFGNTAIGDGHKYRGRGLVQITWKINYERFSKITGVDLVANPDAALDWKNATSIMIEGMLTGAFTGKKLADFMFINNFDYKNARKIINGIDKNIILAEYAEKFAIILRRCI